MELKRGWVYYIDGGHPCTGLALAVSDTQYVWFNGQCGGDPYLSTPRGIQDDYTCLAITNLNDMLAKIDDEYKESLNAH